MTEQSEHLSSAQIENYGNRTSGAGPDAAQGDEPQRVDQRMADKRSDDQSTADQGRIDPQSNDQRINDQRTSDQRANDPRANDQRIEAHLADCSSCRNRLLDFHRSHFTLLAQPAEAERPNAERPKNDPPEHDTSLSGHSPSGHSSSGQRPADSRLEGASPTNSALADSKFANSKYPVQAQVRTAPTPECPSDDALRELAAGLTPEDAATKLTQHAATCNHCGPLLRTYTEIFSDDFTPEEQAALANLQSSSAEWQKNTARQMLQAAGTTAAKTSTDDADTSAAEKESSQQKSFKGSTTTSSGRKPFSWKWALVPATAALVAVAAFSIWYTQRDTPEKVEKLLAEAYTEQRTMEMRIPYAAHADFKQTRSGDNASLLSSPEALRKAADQIAAQLRRNPDDPRWLMLSARLDLLDWRYKSALTTLDKIDDGKADDSSEFLMTQSIAFYEKAEIEHDSLAYREVVELTGKTLQKMPDDTIALFNQAVACEKLLMNECAVQDYERFLKLDRNSGWSAEVRDHLNLIREKKSPER